MVYVTLDMAKRHLNIEPSYTDEDSYIEALISVVEEKTAKELCVPVEGLANIGGGDTIPAPIIQAMLLFIGTYYANREHVTLANIKALPQSAMYLIDLYRNYAK